MLTGMKLGRCVCACALLVACGDDQSGYAPSATYQNRCAAPRPNTVDRQGSLDEEKLFLRSWIDELYLWYAEVPPNDPSLYGKVLDYFAALRTQAVTPSGQPKDRFHFTYTTEQWNK